MKKTEVIQRLKEIIAKQKGILFAYLHGSFLSEDRFNDIDIAVYLSKKMSRSINPFDFENGLALEIDKALNLRIDVKILNFAPLCFNYRVTHGMLLFSRDELVREEFLCRTWSEYFDFLPVSGIYLKEVISV